MKFENLRESFVASEKDSEKYILELEYLIQRIYTGANYKGRNLHELVWN